MGTPPLARACAAVAALIALSSAPVAGASDVVVSSPRPLVAVNGYAAAPAIGPDGQAAVAVSDYGRERSRILAFTRSARGRWAARPLVLRTSRQELLEPRVAFTGDGTGVFTWMRAPRIDQEQVVESRRFSATGALGPVQPVGLPGERAVLARVAGGPGDRALIGWENGDYALHVADGGTGGLSASQRIFDRREVGFALGYLPDGTAVALSQAYGAGGVQVRLKAPGGAGWGQAATLSGPRTAREAVLATGADGTVAVAWAQNTGSGYRVQVSMRPPGGAFSAARTVAADDGDARAPGLAVQPDGSVLLAWLSGVRLGSLVRGTEVRAAVVSSAGGVSPARRVSGAGRRVGTPPQVVVDAEGDALVAWEEGRRLVAAGRSAGGRLTGPRAISALGTRILLSRVAANARGQAVAAWTVDRGRTGDGALIQVAEIDF